MARTIRDLRRDRGLDLDQLGGQLDPPYSGTTISDVELGRRRAGPKLVRALADFYDETPERIRRMIPRARR